MPHFFITGTDTDAGKTYVTCRLLEDLRRRGCNAMGYKPMACGDRGDARAILQATLPTLAIDEINPVYLKAATAPYIAAELEGRLLDTESLAKGFRHLCESYETVLVEGAGGWEVPISPSFSMSDFAVALGLPVILVVGNKLGAVNHCVLTVNAIRARGLKCRGIVLNHIAEEWDTAALTNRKLIEEFTGIPVAAELIHGQEDIDSFAVLGL